MVNAADLPAMNTPFKNPKVIFFTDFDGTITLKDSNDFLVFMISQATEGPILNVAVDRQHRLRWRQAPSREQGCARRQAHFQVLDP